MGCCAHTRRSGFRRQNAFWRRFAYVRKRAPSRKKRYPMLFRNHPGIPDFVNFPIIFMLPQETHHHLLVRIHFETRTRREMKAPHTPMDLWLT